jgi:Tfp pilus assembly protein PilV
MRFEEEQNVLSTRNHRQGAQIVSAIMNGQSRGTSIVETMLAILILVIVLIGTSSMFVSGRRHLIHQRDYQAAAQLAAQKIEECKAIGYADLSEGAETEEISVNGLTYTINTQTVLTATPTSELPKPCKKVTVNITWSYSKDRHQASIVTYIGP